MNLAIVHCFLYNTRLIHILRGLRPRMSTAQLPFHSNSQTDTDSTRTGLDSYLICQLHCGFRGSGDVTEGGEPAA